MSTSDISNLQLAANNLSYIGMMFARCYCYLGMSLGTVGHLFSIYVFTRPSLRSNPCSRYLLAATGFGMMLTLYTLPMRLIQSGFVNTDPGAYSTVFCKITWFILYSIRGLAFWLIVLACVDRYLCSSASTGVRAWSNVRVANRVIPLFILIGFVVYIHVPVFFQINIISATQKPICYPPGPPGTYRIVLSYFNLIFFGLTPPLCMFIFGVLTLRNINQSRQLNNQNTRKSNRHMLRVLFVQVLVYSVTGLAFSISSIIAAMYADQPKNMFQVVQDGLVNAIVGMLSNTEPCFSFYFSTLLSSLFIKELKNLFSKLFRIVQPQHVQTPTLNTNHIKKTVTSKV